MKTRDRSEEVAEAMLADMGWAGDDELGGGSILDYPIVHVLLAALAFGSVIVMIGVDRVTRLFGLG